MLELSMSTWRSTISSNLLLGFAFIAINYCVCGYTALSADDSEEVNCSFGFEQEVWDAKIGAWKSDRKQFSWGELQIKGDLVHFVESDCFSFFS